MSDQLDLHDGATRGALEADEPIEAAIDSEHRCECCDKAFMPRTGSGGRPQRFCSPTCRTAHANANKSPAIAPTDTPQPETLPRMIAEPGPQDFDWSKDDSVVIREQRETAVYFNPHGQVVIRQRADWNEDEDPFLVFDVHYLATLIDHLEMAKQEAYGHQQ